MLKIAKKWTFTLVYRPVEDKTARTLEKHREVINDENSDTDYQTSLEDQDDFRSIQTRHEQLPTQTTTSRSDFDIVEREQTPPVMSQQKFHRLLNNTVLMAIQNTSPVNLESCNKHSAQCYTG